MNSYELSRNFIDFSFENPTKIKPIHYAIYFFSIEHCNRLGWKKEFGLPTTMTMEAIGVRSYNTYSKALFELVDYGFIKMIEKSKNQYSSNIIALSNFNKALDKALDKAFIKHTSKQSESTVSINKPITINNKQINKASPFSFYNSLLKLGADKQLASEWLKVRKTKKATNSETAFNSFVKQQIKSKATINEVLELCVIKSWSGFKSEWYEKPNEEPKTKAQIYEEKLAEAFKNRKQ